MVQSPTPTSSFQRGGRASSMQSPQKHTPPKRASHRTSDAVLHAAQTTATPSPPSATPPARSRASSSPDGVLTCGDRGGRAIRSRSFLSARARRSAASGATLSGMGPPQQNYTSKHRAAPRTARFRVRTAARKWFGFVARGRSGAVRSRAALAFRRRAFLQIGMQRPGWTAQELGSCRSGSRAHFAHQARTSRVRGVTPALGPCWHMACSAQSRGERLMLTQTSIHSTISAPVARKASSPPRELEIYGSPAVELVGTGVHTRFDRVLQALAHAEQHDGWQPVRRRSADDLRQENP